MHKFIVKNCPAFTSNGECRIDYKYPTHYVGICKNYTDCVIKITIRYCKDNIYDDYGEVQNYKAYYDILQLFDIQEAE